MSYCIWERSLRVHGTATTLCWLFGEGVEFFFSKIFFPYYVALLIFVCVCRVLLFSPVYLYFFDSSSPYIFAFLFISCIHSLRVSGRVRSSVCLCDSLGCAHLLTPPVRSRCVVRDKVKSLYVSRLLSFYSARHFFL